MIVSQGACQLADRTNDVRWNEGAAQQDCSHRWRSWRAAEPGGRPQGLNQDRWPALLQPFARVRKARVRWRRSGTNQTLPDSDEEARMLAREAAISLPIPHGAHLERLVLCEDCGSPGESQGLLDPRLATDRSGGGGRISKRRSGPSVDRRQLLRRGQEAALAASTAVAVSGATESEAPLAPDNLQPAPAPIEMAAQIGAGAILEVAARRTDRDAAFNRGLDEGEAIATLDLNGPPK